MKLSIATPLGTFVAHYSDHGLAGLDFPHRGRPGRSGGRALPRVSSAARGWHRLAAAALKNVLAGRAPKKLPPLDWTGKTEFQKAVWREMMKLAPGQTKSYGEMARAIGRPKAVRAVGSACGANPVPVLVPCHRVLAAHGKIGGFGGGLDWKRELLKREGIRI